MNNPVDQPKVSELDEKALEAALEVWDVTDTDRWQEATAAAIRAYIAALPRSALIGIPGAEKGEAADDSDPPMAALLWVERDGSLPDNARRAAQLAVAEITRLRSVHPAPTSERVQALEKKSP